jgi:hypothetical protein
LAALFLGLATRRATLSFVPLLGVGGFLAYVMTSDERYSSIPEELQITAIYALGGSVAFLLLGVVIRRIVDAERLRRRSPSAT